MIYPTVAGHALLTAKASAKVTASTEYQELAEDLLGLQSPALTVAADVARVKRAIVVQINFQVEQGVDAFIHSWVASSHSNQQIGYRDRYLSPQAVAILASIDALAENESDRYETFTSHRTRDDS